MPQRMKFGDKLKGSSKELADEELEGFYNGPTPPKGVYRTKLKFLRVTKTQDKKKDLLKGLLEVNEPEGSKNAKYNGYGIWFNQTIHDEGIRFLNATLDAICPKSVPKPKFRKMFYEQVVVEKEDGYATVLKIGTVRIDGADLPVVVDAKINSYNDELQVKRWLSPVNEDDEDTSDPNEIEDDDEEVEESEEVEEDADDDEDGDDIDDDEPPF